MSSNGDCDTSAAIRQEVSQILTQLRMQRGGRRRVSPFKLSKASSTLLSVKSSIKILKLVDKKDQICTTNEINMDISVTGKICESTRRLSPGKT